MTRLKTVLIGIFSVSLMITAGVFLGTPHLWAAGKAGRDSLPFSQAMPASGLARGVANYIMGVHQELLEAEEGSVAFFEQAVAADDASFTAHLRLGTAYVRVSNIEGALKEFSRAASLDPSNLQPHYFQALLYDHLNDTDKAAVEYEFILSHVAKKDSKNTEALLYLGQLYASRGDEKKAIATFEKIHAIDPDNVDILYLLGTYYLEGPRKAEGKTLLGRCVQLDPENAECLNALAYVNAQDNSNLPVALSLVDQALEIEVDNAAYLDTRGWVLYRLKRYDEALTELLKADALLKDPEILGHLVAVYSKLGLVEKMVAVQAELEALQVKEKKAAGPIGSEKIENRH